MTRKQVLIGAMGAALATGCSEALTSVSSTGTGRPDAATTHANAPAIDVSGEWVWSRELSLIFPVWVAQGVFGIEPEGPSTSARCTGSGTMTLVQNGSSFSGVSQNTEGQCVTRGGQVFPGVAPDLPQPVEDGVIRGRSLNLHLIAAGGSLDCTSHAVVTELDGGTATALRGGGPCIIPGHPKSAVPLDPPPGGTQTILSWTAERP